MGDAVVAVTVTTEAEEDVFSTEGTVEEPQSVDFISLPPEPEPEVEVDVEEHQIDDSIVIEAIEPEVKVIVSEEEDAAHNEDVASPQPEPEPEPESEPMHEPGHEKTASEVTLAVGESDLEETEEHTTDSITDKLAALASKHDDTDIEQIVNLLETVPTAIPASATISPSSDMQEIPDEEH